MNDLAENLKKYNNSNAKKLSADLIWLSKKASEYETIDSYAKQLQMHIYDKIPGMPYGDLERQIDKRDEYRRLKNVLSTFFTIAQYNKLDHRYNKLLSHLLIKERNSIFIMRNNVNILSWNYDNQVEIAYSSNYEKSITKDVHAMLASYPSPYSLGDKYYHPYTKFDVENYKMSIVHLNGVSGLYVLDNKFEMIDIINSKSFNEVVNSSVKVYESGNSYLNFSWDKEGAQTIELAIKNTVDTEILIIIGYSLPIFNKQTDKKIFSNYSRLRKIYFQNIEYKSKAEIIEELWSRGIKPEVDIIFEYDISSFKIPDEIG